jgi:hypothetical protein
MKKPVGRPKLNPSFALVTWVLVELLRDTQGNEPRLSAREAAKKLAFQLRRDCRGGRPMPFNTVRRHYKNFQRVMATGSDEQRRVAISGLEFGRQRREVLGWDASVLFFAIAQWDNYEAEIRDHQIRLTRLPIQAR